MLFTIELPENIPAPKYKMFEGLNRNGQEVAVVGISYALPWFQSFGGWHYQVDPMVPIWMDAGCPDQSDWESIPEEDLELISKAKKSRSKRGGPAKVAEVLPEVVDKLNAA